MEPGAFSISLAVKDLLASRSFYEKFGFTVFAREVSGNRLVMKNGQHAIGLFQGMFERNTLTFNPGWDSTADKLRSFTDVRDLQRQLKVEGVNYWSRLTRPPRAPPLFSFFGASCYSARSREAVVIMASRNESLQGCARASYR